MINWFHKLFNPHCEHCREIELESKICNSCEILKDQLVRSNIENDKLVQLLLEKMSPSEPAHIDTSELKPIQSKSIPWNIRRQMLEDEDRAKARVIAEKERMDELEKEVLGK